MKKVQAVLAIIVGLVATAFAGTTLISTSQPASISDASSYVFEANANFDLNSENTDNVYQQIVVAGWGTREMVEAVAKETAGLSDAMVYLLDEQKRSSTLLAILVGLMGVVIALIASSSLAGKTAKSPSHSVSEETEPKVNPA
jgi:hypothetical protein